MLIMPAEWLSHFKNKKEAFNAFLNMQGEVFRHEKNRKTLRFVFMGQPYFIKIHQGVGWKEIFKNLFSLKTPILGARNERDALKKLATLNVPTLEAVAFAEEGLNPAAKCSFLVTKEIAPHTDLAKLLIDWRDDPTKFSLKVSFIKKIAMIAQAMHVNGINHRDFYLCHFIVKSDQPFNEHNQIHIIDLHRAQIRKQVPSRWLVKDLAGLYFSAMEINLSQRDCLRLLKYYRGKDLRTILQDEITLWKNVTYKAQALYKKTYGKNYEDCFANKLA